MPGQYRLELAPNRRAGCMNKECKDEAIKFEKGELRIGVFVTIGEHQNWHWKHWGCTTPQVIANINEAIEGDTDLFDGYDELPEEEQTRVSQALEQGHVADEDWKGDIEVNRPGQKGFRSAATKARLRQEKKEKETEANGGAEESPAKSSAKKRGRGEQGAADKEEGSPVPAAKRAKKGRKVKEEVEEEAKNVATTKKVKEEVKKEAKKEVKKEESDSTTNTKEPSATSKRKPRVKQEDQSDNEINGEPETAAVEKKPASRKSKRAALADDGVANKGGNETASPQAVKGSKATAKANTKAKRAKGNDTEAASAPAKASQKPKAASKKGNVSSEVADDGADTNKVGTGRGRKKGVEVVEEHQDEEETTVAKKPTRSRGRARKTAST